MNTSFAHSLDIFGRSLPNGPSKKLCLEAAESLQSPLEQFVLEYTTSIGASTVQREMPGRSGAGEL